MKNNVEISPVEAAALLEMRDELDAYRLEVVLVPQRYRTNEGGMIRVAATKNAQWYRNFCARYASSRRRKNCAFDTRIKRRDTLRVLDGLINKSRAASQYAADFLAEARARARKNPDAYKFVGKDVEENAVNVAFACAGDVETDSTPF